MSVVLFSRSSPRERGGMEAIFSHLVLNLQVDGDSPVPVYCSSDGVGPSGRGMLEEPIEVGLTELRTRWKIPTIGSVGAAIRSLLRLARLLRHLRPTVVNCHYVDFRSVYFALLKPVFGYRLVLTCHGSDVMRPSALDRRVQPFIFRSADHVITVSPQLREKVLELAPHGPPVTIITNGIDLLFWQALEWRPAGPPTIVSVGALRPVKGHDVLVDAFSRVKRRVPEAQLTLIGEGPAEADLVAQATHLGLRDSITFAGWCDRTTIREHLRRARTFAFPSRSEGLGLALIEALAVGTPCVASNVGGIPEVVSSPAVGRLVPSEDPDALAHELVRVLCEDNLAKRLSKAGRERAQAFSWEEAVGLYEQVLQG